MNAKTRVQLLAITTMAQSMTMKPITITITIKTGKDRQRPASDSSCDKLGKSHPPGHVACSDDGCTAIQFAKFKFQSLDFSVPYLGGVDSLALIESQRNSGWDVDPFPDCSFTETGVRAHLLFGVQLL